MDKKKSIFRLIKYLKGYNYFVIVALISTLVAVVANAIVPKKFGEATTTVIKGFIINNSIDFNELYPIIKLLVILYIITGICTYISQYIVSTITSNVVYNLRKDLRDKFKNLPVSYYDKNETGEIMSKITNDITVIGSSLGQIINQSLNALLTIISIVVVMFSVNVTLSIIILLSVPVTVVATAMLAKKSQPLFKAKQRMIGEANAYVEEYFTGFEVVNTYNKRKDTLEEFERINDQLCDVSMKAHRISSIIFPISLLINNLSYVLVIVVGFSKVLSGTLEIGYVQSMIQYTKRLGQPIGNLANIMALFQSTIAASDRVFDLLDEKEEDNSETLELGDIKGKINLKNVTFAYNENKNILEDISFEIKPGETIAIVGPTGSGKTTLINLLMRFYDSNSGVIELDGTDITKLTKNNLRSKIGMVLQETWLFNGSILENLRYGRENATDEEVIQAAKKANADTFIRQMPNGYNTILSEEMDNISVGQKQLLTIARAIVGNPDIFILDEATSNIDNKTEKHIQATMDQIMSEKTSIVIAHRLSTIENADKIIVIKDGRLIENGNHKELLANKGFYYSLYNAQYTV